VDGVVCASGCGLRGEQCPLVVALHGGGDHDASKLRAGLFGSDSMFQQGSFCILFALSTSGEEWDVGYDSKDTPHVLDITSAAIESHNIDRGAVFLLGYSRGSVAAYLTVCTKRWENPFAAVAAVASQVTWYRAPGYIGRYCCPNPKFHLMHVHGSEDKIVPIDTKKPWSCAVPGEIVSKHGKSDNRCGGPSTSTSTHQGASVVAYDSGCSGSGSAALYRLEGAGHDIVTNALWRDAWDYFMKHKASSYP